MSNRLPLVVAVVVASGMLAAACASSDGDPAVWALDPTDLPAESSESFTVLVMRVGCAGGRTGEVLQPTIEASDDEIVITFTVAPVSGAQDCPGNDIVPIVVDVGEPIDGRRIVDGSCRTGAAPAGLCDEAANWLPPDP